MNNYEGMFLFDPAVSTEWADVEAEINRLLGRAEAELIFSRKWDERRLAYEIKGRRRGLYALTFFRADGGRIASLLRDVELSERVLRLLVLRVDHMTEDEMCAVEAAPPESDRDRPYRDRGRPYRDRGGRDRDRGDRDRGDRDRGDRDRGRPRSDDGGRDRPSEAPPGQKPAAAPESPTPAAVSEPPPAAVSEPPPAAVSEPTPAPVSEPAPPPAAPAAPPPIGDQPPAGETPTTNDTER